MKKIKKYNLPIIVILQPKEIESGDTHHGFIKTYIKEHKSKESALKEYGSLEKGTIYHAWKIKFVAQKI